MTDAAGDCTYVNPRCCEILGMPPKNAMGQGWSKAIHPEDRDRILSQRHEAQRMRGVYESEHRFRWPNGKSVWVAAKSVAIRDDSGKPAGRIGILIDITDRKQVEKRLRLLLDEQERVAQDLHDGCIQTIYAIGLNLEECRTLVRDHPRKASKKIAATAADLNLVIHDLRLFILGDQREIAGADDLKAALEKTVRMMGDSLPAFAVEIDAAAAATLTPDQAMHLLQIARAALGNAARHANAQSGLLSLQMRDGAISLEVSDDGVGFDAEEIEKPGLGLHNIEARARKLGGRLRLVSRPEKGTRVVVRIPRTR